MRLRAGRRLRQLIHALRRAWTATLLASCQAAGSVTAPHASQYWIADDGLHTGIILEAKDASLDREDAAGTNFSNARYLEFGFSERRWALGDASIVSELLARPLSQHEGVILIQPYELLADAANGRRLTRHHAPAQVVAAIPASIATWLSRPLEAAPSPIRPGLWLLRSNQPYTLACNCRHFVKFHINAATEFASNDGRLRSSTETRR
jgi:hypothetical protein